MHSRRLKPVLVWTEFHEFIARLTEEYQAIKKRFTEVAHQKPDKALWKELTELEYAMQNLFQGALLIAGKYPAGVSLRHMDDSVFHVKCMVLGARIYCLMDSWGFSARLNNKQIEREYLLKASALIATGQACDNKTDTLQEIYYCFTRLKAINDLEHILEKQYLEKCMLEWARKSESGMIKLEFLIQNVHLNISEKQMKKAVREIKSVYGDIKKSWEISPKNVEETLQFLSANISLYEFQITHNSQCKNQQFLHQIMVGNSDFFEKNFDTYHQITKTYLLPVIEIILKINPEDAKRFFLEFSLISQRVIAQLIMIMDATDRLKNSVDIGRSKFKNKLTEILLNFQKIFDIYKQFLDGFLGISATNYSWFQYAQKHKLADHELKDIIQIFNNRKNFNFSGSLTFENWGIAEKQSREKMLQLIHEEEIKNAQSIKENPIKKSSESLSSEDTETTEEIEQILPDIPVKNMENKFLKQAAIYMKENNLLLAIASFQDAVILEKNTDITTQWEILDTVLMAFSKIALRELNQIKKYIFNRLKSDKPNAEKCMKIKIKFQIVHAVFLYLEAHYAQYNQLVTTQKLKMTPAETEKITECSNLIFLNIKELYVIKEEVFLQYDAMLKHIDVKKEKFIEKLGWDIIDASRGLEPATPENAKKLGVSAFVTFSASNTRLTEKKILKDLTKMIHGIKKNTGNISHLVSDVCQPVYQVSGDPSQEIQRDPNRLFSPKSTDKHPSYRDKLLASQEPSEQSSLS